MNVILFVILYLMITNVAAFVMMGLDKWKAKKHTFRIPESTLFIVAFIGGSIGAILGMFAFRHKTRHWYFLYGLPVILILQMIIIYLLYTSPLQFALL